jgi:hypothetical protein
MRAYESAYEEEQELIHSRFALVCMVLAEVNRNPKAKKHPYKVEDFMPQKQKTKEELIGKIEGLKNYLGQI